MNVPLICTQRNATYHTRILQRDAIVSISMKHVILVSRVFALQFGSRSCSSPPDVDTLKAHLPTRRLVRRDIISQTLVRISPSATVFPHRCW